jgi:hypothetical protein
MEMPGALRRNKRRLKDAFAQRGNVPDRLPAFVGLLELHQGFSARKAYAGVMHFSRNHERRR